MPGARVNTYAASTIVEALTASGDRAKIPVGDFASLVGGWSADDWIYCAIRSATAREIVKVNVGESNVFQGLKIERGQDGDTAQAWPAGSLIYQVLNAATLNHYLQEGQHREVAYNPNGVLAPLYFGEKVYQTDLALWWMSASDAGTEWRLIAGEMVVWTPDLSPPPGDEYDNFQTVTMECLTPGAFIFYTLDGSTPNENSTLYTGPVELPYNATTTVKAIAIHPDRWWTDSLVASGTYTTSTGPAADPVITPDSGTYANYQQVEISSDTLLATIHYTLDGSDPDESSPVYEGPFLLPNDATTTVKAFAAQSPDGGALWLASNIVSETFTTLGPCADPIISPPTGFYANGQQVTITCETPGATIYYTTDGSTPGPGSSVYSAPISLPNDSYTVVKAYAIASPRWDSGVVMASYDTCDLLTITPMLVGHENNYLFGVKSDGTCLVAYNGTYLPVGVYNWTNIAKIVTSSLWTFGVTTDRTCRCIYSGSYGTPCIPDVSNWSDIIDIRGSGHVAIGLKSNGTCVVAAHSWYTGSSDIFDAEAWTDIVQIETCNNYGSCSDAFVIGLKSDGTCVAAGYYTWLDESHAYPQCDVAGWTNIKSITANEFITVGLRQDGTLVNTAPSAENAAWQSYVNQIGGNVQQIFAGAQCLIALKNDGTCVAAGNALSDVWGENDYLEVGGWTDIIQVAGGGPYNVGLKSDGTCVGVGRFYRTSSDYSPANIQNYIGWWDLF